LSVTDATSSEATEDEQVTAGRRSTRISLIAGIGFADVGGALR